MPAAARTASASTSSSSTSTSRRSRTAPPAPLGSLTQREHRAEGGCASCGGSRLTRLALSLTDGTPVTFSSCHDCQHRSWVRADGEVALDAVLEHTRKR